jgi:hypothetical protein
VLYVPAGFIGLLAAQYLLSSLVSTPNRIYLEHSYQLASLVYSAFQMLIGQTFKIRSSYIFAIITVVSLQGIFLSGVLRRDRSNKVGLKSAYMFPLVMFIILGVEAITNVSCIGTS